MTDDMFKKKTTHAIKQTEADLDETRTVEPTIGDPPIEWDRMAWFGSKLGISGGGGGTTTVVAPNWGEFTDSIIPADDDSISLGQEYTVRTAGLEDLPLKRWANLVAKKVTVNELHPSFPDTLTTTKQAYIEVFASLRPHSNYPLGDRYIQRAGGTVGTVTHHWNQFYTEITYTNDIIPLDIPDTNNPHVEIFGNLVPDTLTTSSISGRYNLGYTDAYWKNTYTENLWISSSATPSGTGLPTRGGVILYSTIKEAGSTDHVLKYYDGSNSHTIATGAGSGFDPGNIQESLIPRASDATNPPLNIGSVGAIWGAVYTGTIRGQAISTRSNTETIYTVGDIVPVKSTANKRQWDLGGVTNDGFVNIYGEVVHLDDIRPLTSSATDKHVEIYADLVSDTGASTSSTTGEHSLGRANSYWKGLYTEAVWLRTTSTIAANPPSTGVLIYYDAVASKPKYRDSTGTPHDFDALPTWGKFTQSITPATTATAIQLGTKTSRWNQVHTNVLYLGPASSTPSNPPNNGALIWANASGQLRYRLGSGTDQSFIFDGGAIAKSIWSTGTSATSGQVANPWAKTYTKAIVPGNARGGVAANYFTLGDATRQRVGFLAKILNTGIPFGNNLQQDIGESNSAVRALYTGEVIFPPKTRSLSLTNRGIMYMDSSGNLKWQYGSNTATLSDVNTPTFTSVSTPDRPTATNAVTLYNKSGVLYARKTSGSDVSLEAAGGTQSNTPTYTPVSQTIAAPTTNNAVILFNDDGTLSVRKSDGSKVSLEGGGGFNANSLPTLKPNPDSATENLGGDGSNEQWQVLYAKQLQSRYQSSTSFTANNNYYIQVNSILRPRVSGTLFGSTTHRWDVQASALNVTGTSTFAGNLIPSGSRNLGAAGNNQQWHQLFVQELWNKTEATTTSGVVTNNIIHVHSHIAPYRDKVVQIGRSSVRFDGYFRDLTAGGEGTDLAFVDLRGTISLRPYSPSTSTNEGTVALFGGLSLASNIRTGNSLTADRNIQANGGLTTSSIKLGSEPAITAWSQLPGGGSTPTPTIPTRRSRLPVQVFSGTPSTANLNSWFGSGHGAVGIVVTSSNPTSASQVRLYFSHYGTQFRVTRQRWRSIPFGSYLGRRGSDTSVASQLTITVQNGTNDRGSSAINTGDINMVKQGRSNNAADGQLCAYIQGFGANFNVYLCVYNKFLTYPPYSSLILGSTERANNQLGTMDSMPNALSLPNENASTLDQYFGGGRDNGAMGISVDTLYVKVRGRWFALGLNYDGPRPGTGSGEFEGGDVPNPTTFKSLVTFEGGVSGITGGGSNTPTYTSVSSQPNAPSPTDSLTLFNQGGVLKYIKQGETSAVTIGGTSGGGIPNPIDTDLIPAINTNGTPKRNIGADGKLWLNIWTDFLNANSFGAKFEGRFGIQDTGSVRNVAYPGENNIGTNSDIFVLNKNGVLTARHRKKNSSGQWIADFEDFSLEATGGGGGIPNEIRQDLTPYTTSTVSQVSSYDLGDDDHKWGEIHGGDLHIASIESSKDESRQRTFAHYNRIEIKDDLESSSTSGTGAGVGTDAYPFNILTVRGIKLIGETNTITRWSQVGGGGGGGGIPDSISKALIPSIDDNYNIGSPTKAWNNLYIDNILPRQNQSGNNREVTIGATDNDRIELRGFISGDVIPTVSDQGQASRNLGSDNNYWNHFYCDQMNVDEKYNFNPLTTSAFAPRGGASIYLYKDSNGRLYLRATFRGNAGFETFDLAMTSR